MDIKDINYLYEIKQRDVKNERLINQLYISEAVYMANAGYQSKKGNRAYNRWRGKIVNELFPGSREERIDSFWRGMQKSKIF